MRATNRFNPNWRQTLDFVLSLIVCLMWVAALWMMAVLLAVSR